MGNNGKKGWATLEEYYLDSGKPTGYTKPNVPGDPDYVPPVDDFTFCPPASTNPPSGNCPQSGGDLFFKGFLQIRLAKPTQNIRDEHSEFFFGIKDGDNLSENMRVNFPVGTYKMRFTVRGQNLSLHKNGNLLLTSTTSTLYIPSLTIADNDVFEIIAENNASVNPQYVGSGVTFSLTQDSSITGGYFRLEAQYNNIDIKLPSGSYDISAFHALHTCVYLNNNRIEEDPHSVNINRTFDVCDVLRIVGSVNGQCPTQLTS